MSEQHFLDDITPPPGGWQRLLARRDALSREPGLGIPLAAAAVLAVVVVLVRPQPRELQIPWDAARLTDQPSEGVGLKSVRGAQATQLMSDDPRVHFYWLQSTTGP
jgi:hypothetical protein